MVDSQSIAKSKCSVCYMTFKYADEFLCARLCPVDSGGKGIPFVLDACADAHIFIGNAPFCRFGPILVRLSVNGTIQFFTLVAIGDKGFVKLRHITKANPGNFGKSLQCHKYLVPHVKDCLMGITDPLGGVINGIAMDGILNNLTPYRY